MVKLEPTGKLGEYSKEMESATFVIIRALVNKGSEYILLNDLYQTMGADTKSLKCSVRWAIRKCKDHGILAKVKGHRGIYAVM